jgi:N-acetylmuramoyl-L-alanine amidase
MRNRALKLIMAVLMIAAVYITFRYKVAESSVAVSQKEVIVIDPGHGGEDPGKVGINDALEKEVNLSISLFLKEDLEAEGYTVILTRNDDDGLYTQSDTNKKLADMKKRCKIIEESSASIVVSIHQNSFSQESAHGGQIFYYKYSAEGKRLAECLQDAFHQYIDEENDRQAKSNDNYYMLLHTPCPTVIAECGFLSNSAEAELLCSEEYQKKVAAGICQGILEYFRASKG